MGLAIESYTKAEKGKLDFYSRINVIQLQLILCHFKVGNYKKLVIDFDALKKEFSSYAINTENYYDVIHGFNIEVTQYLLNSFSNNDKQNIDDTIAHLSAIFVKIWNDTGSFSNLNGEIEHHEMLMGFIAQDKAEYFVVEGLIERMKSLKE